MLPRNAMGLPLFALFLLLRLSRISVAQLDSLAAVENVVDQSAHRPVGPNTYSKCYDHHGKGQRCVTTYENAAYGKPVTSTNTCGVRQPIQFCVQTGASGAHKTCDICDAKILGQEHPPKYLTDFNYDKNVTWWQSETMLEKIQYPNSINLTLSLGKSFEVTYVRLKFHTSRPESFAIYKKATKDGDWIPWQYYSATCRQTYGVSENMPIASGDKEDVPLCSGQYSLISPLSGGDVVFPTLEGRPSARHYLESPELREWATATEIMIVLNRLNTFGDEVYQDPKVLRTYYYAISDLTVGGRCKCNGHANECVKSTGAGVNRLVCRCSHFTTGQDCDECLPTHNDRPWQRATLEGAFECRECNCSGLATHCEFNQKQFDETGSGGLCVNCRGFTTGPHCENCEAKHFRIPNSKECQPCSCNDVGSADLQCDDDGMCPCKDGVGGQRCDRCDDGYFEFSDQGCKTCGCEVAGSVENQPRCNDLSGQCHCKTNVEGKQCKLCKPGHFNLHEDNDFGCLSCFCFGHSSVCASADNYYRADVKSDFTSSADGWKGEAYSGSLIPSDHDKNDDSIAVPHTAGGESYFRAPAKFLGDQRASYNQYLSFALRVSDQGVRGTNNDIIIEGAGRMIYVTIYANQQPNPTTQFQTYRYRLHEDSRYRWYPQLSTNDFMALLANITSIKIRATYGYGGWGYLTNVTLGSAKMMDSSDSSLATWIEKCECPEGYVGQFCEQCDAGYTRERGNGGPFTRCVPCECNGHSETCDIENGQCDCEHNTAGKNCERCEDRYYGDALNGTDDACQECPCPFELNCKGRTKEEGDTGADVICLNCPEGYEGHLCELCSNGFFGDPSKGKDCVPCECNDNIDPNAVDTCNGTTGECLECGYNTAGFNCELCEPGFWGDALIQLDCEACNCYTPGSVRLNTPNEVLTCDQDDGQCACLPHVLGKRCDACESGFFNITSGEGCQACTCDSDGSLNTTCDLVSGQCQCRPGITGRQCDQCKIRHYGFGGDEGCEPCDCYAKGSLAYNCEVESGQCECRPNIEGRRCDRCMENMYGLDEYGCVPCEPCYKMVQQLTNEQRPRVKELQTLVDDIRNNPQVVDDKEFEAKLEEVMASVEALADKVDGGLPDDSGLLDELNNLFTTLDEIRDTLKTINATLEEAHESARQAGVAIDRYKPSQDRIESRLADVKRLVNDDLKQAVDQAAQYMSQLSQRTNEMAGIAEEAARLSDSQTQRALNVTRMAEQANSISEEALRNAEKAVAPTAEEGQTSEEVRKLKETLEATRDLLNKTAAVAEDLKNQGGTVLDKAAEALKNANDAEIPEIDVEKHKKQAGELKNDTTELREQAGLQTNEYNDVISEAEVLRNQARFDIERAEREQQAADATLAEVDALRGKATDALEDAEQTLRNANETLLTLQEFDKRVEDGKEGAADAYAEVDAVRKELDDVAKRLKAHKEKFGTVKEDAKKTEEAMKELDELSAKAKELANAAAEKMKTLVKDAEKLAEYTGVIFDASKVFEQTHQNYRVHTTEIKKEMDETLQEAAAAELEGERTMALAEKTKQRLQAIIAELTRIDDVSDADVDELEKELDEAEAQLETLELEGEIKQLTKDKDLRAEELAEIQREIAKWEREVEKVEATIEALPKQCFNTVDIEVPKR